MGILQAFKNAFRRLVGRSGPREPANLEKARSDHKAVKEEKSRLDEATTALERERKLAIERKSNVVGLADVVAGRKDSKKVDDPIDKPETLLEGGKNPGPKKPTTKPKKSVPKPAKSALKTKPRVHKKT
ncbi:MULTISPECIES: hypothetical protein [Aminobacter]|uniref:Uncharacterized protein n=3 Tax=Aminobacter TaxID=31988 RepID=A0AAC8YJF8_AMIAI|nr:MULTISPECIES: hypothetical protein [Aminobacter]AMS39341.1 hypothetical protein AA2016_0402 [Aminobacter aminovorans]MBA8910220.1 hypothetical protein [Aminobacter ciceronei]MBA9023956.1 hypothetical protein [Aminobacter ciceronei]MBB3709953.1 hypothetical protein [Aminobacter aminovorans]MBB6470410.1 hypothetical protein [Aminobacter lissarensis]